MKTYTLTENGVCRSMVTYSTLEAARAAKAQYVYADRGIVLVNEKFEILEVIE